MSSRCAACGAAALAPHMAVAGSAGDGGLIPTTDRYGTALADIARCAVCGHMQLATMPSSESLAEAYGEAESSDYVEEEAGQRASFAAVPGLEQATAETLRDHLVSVAESRRTGL